MPVVPLIPMEVLAALAKQGTGHQEKTISSFMHMVAGKVPLAQKVRVLEAAEVVAQPRLVKPGLVHLLAKAATHLSEA